MTLRSNGSYIGYNQADTLSSATGVWSIDEVYRRRDESNWPEVVNVTYDTLTLDTVDVRDPAGYEVSATNNSTEDYGIHHVQFTADATSHVLYIGFELRGTNSAFYKDYTVGAVRLNYGSTTSTFFNTLWTGWQTTTAGVSSSTSPTGLTYTNIATGTTAERFNIDGAGTGSSSTGVLYGVGTSAPDLHLLNEIAQANSSYVYVETSSPTANGDTIWLKYSFNPAIGDTVKIDIADYLNTDTTGTYASVVQNSVRLLVT